MFFCRSAVAGPVAVQIARSRSKHASLVGSSSGALLPQGSAHAPLPAEPATSAVSTGTVSHPAPSAAASTLAVPEASGDGGSAWRLGVFGQVKVWGEGSAVSHIKISDSSSSSSSRFCLVMGQSF
jgi:hypothetical protein